MNWNLFIHRQMTVAFLLCIRSANICSLKLFSLKVSQRETLFMHIDYTFPFEVCFNFLRFFQWFLLCTIQWPFKLILAQFFIATPPGGIEMEYWVVMRSVWWQLSFRLKDMISQEARIRELQILVFELKKENSQEAERVQEILQVLSGFTKGANYVPNQ